MRQVPTWASSQDQLPEGILYEVVGLMVTSEAFGQVTGQYGAISSAASLVWEVLVNKCPLVFR